MNTMIVHNLIAMNMRVLAPNHVMASCYSMLNLIVDAASTTFKVVFIDHRLNES